jgi:hypothetical protein
LNDFNCGGKSTIFVRWREAKRAKKRFGTAISVSPRAKDGETLLRQARKVKSHLAVTDSAIQSEKEPVELNRLDRLFRGSFRQKLVELAGLFQQ